MRTQFDKLQRKDTRIPGKSRFASKLFFDTRAGKHGELEQQVKRRRPKSEDTEHLHNGNDRD